MLMNGSSQVSLDGCHHFLRDSVLLGHFRLLRYPFSNNTWSSFPSDASALLSWVSWEAVRWSWECEKFHGYSTRDRKEWVQERLGEEVRMWGQSDTVSVCPRGSSGAMIAYQRSPALYRNGCAYPIIAQSLAGTHPKNSMPLAWKLGRPLRLWTKYTPHNLQWVFSQRKSAWSTFAVSDTYMLGAGADSYWSGLLTFQGFCKLIVKQPWWK